MTARTSRTAIKTTTSSSSSPGSLKPRSSTRCTICGHTRPSAVEITRSAAASPRFQRYGPTNRRSRRYMATVGRFFAISPRWPHMNMWTPPPPIGIITSNTRYPTASRPQPHCAEIFDAAIPHEPRRRGVGLVREQKGYPERIGAGDLGDLLVELGALGRIRLGPGLPDQTHDE